MHIYGNQRVLARTSLEIALSLVASQDTSPADILAMVYLHLTGAMEMSPEETAHIHEWMQASIDEYRSQSAPL